MAGSSPTAMTCSSCNGASLSRGQGLKHNLSDTQYITNRSFMMFCVLDRTCCGTETHPRLTVPRRFTSLFFVISMPESLMKLTSPAHMASKGHRAKLDESPEMLAHRHTSIKIHWSFCPSGLVKENVDETVQLRLGLLRFRNGLKTELIEGSGQNQNQLMN